MPHVPDLRLSASQTFERHWGEAINAGSELTAAFERLATAITALAEHGIRQTLTFKDPLVQEWWVIFQERRGQMIPRDTLESPIPSFLLEAVE